MMIKFHMEAFQEGKSMQKIHYLHQQEDLQLHRLEMQITLDSQTPLIGTKCSNRSTSSQQTGNAF